VREEIKSIMLIRKAKPSDASSIATCIALAMDEIIYAIIGEIDDQKAHDFLLEMASQPANQYSFECCWVVEENDEVVAVTNVYDGGNLLRLREPIRNAVQTKFGRELNIEDETKKGEIYIDCIGVKTEHQGKGLGAKLLQFLIEKYGRLTNYHLSLLVDEENPRAKKLYKKLGFQVVEECQLGGETMERMYWFEREI